MLKNLADRKQASSLSDSAMTRSDSPDREEAKTSEANPTPRQSKRSVAMGLSQPNVSLFRGVAMPGLLSAIALWASFAPLNWYLLAWFAPVGWLFAIDRRMPLGRAGYWWLWISGCVFWLPILQGIRLAYWPLVFGWLALALYLAAYIPLFVGISRILHFVWRWPLFLAAPTAWSGLELIRSHLLTGYAASGLSHSQVHFPLVMQVADQVGAGGLSFIMMSVSVAVYRLLPKRFDAGQQNAKAVRNAISAENVKSFEIAAGAARTWLGAAVWAGLLLSTVMGYGAWRLRQAEVLFADEPPLLSVLLIQENTPSIFDSYSEKRNQNAWLSYVEMTRKAAQTHGSAELIVWPESTFTGNEPWAELDLSGRALPPELAKMDVDDQQLRDYVEYLSSVFVVKAQRVQAAVVTGAQAASLQAQSSQFATPQAKSPHLLLGCDAIVYRSDVVQRFNAAMFVGPDGSLIDQYRKMHLVMFGEYIPLGPALWWLRDLVGLSGLNSGSEPKNFHIGDVRLAPNICFESMLPHFVSWQVGDLVERGAGPDILMNITNDSWFRGSTILDHHLASSIVCAVENRRPMLVAANTGLSAEIDGSGRLLQVTERLQADAIFAQPKRDGRWGLVQSVGYPLSWLCAAVCAMALALRVFATKAAFPWQKRPQGANP